MVGSALGRCPRSDMQGHLFENLLISLFNGLANDHMELIKEFKILSVLSYTPSTYKYNSQIPYK